MPVVHVVQNLAIGGLERVVLNLAAHVHRERFPSAIVCLGPGGPLVEQARAAGVGVSVLDQRAGFRPGTVLGLARAFRAQRVGIVHCHNAAPLVYGAAAARISGTAVVYTAHGMKTSGARQPVCLARLGLVDEFVTVSDDARRIAIESAGAAPERVQRIWNGVDSVAYRRADDETRARVRRSLGLPADAFVFTMVARLSAAKDHANLIRAFAAVSARDPRADLVVVGDGELRADVEKLVNELGLADRIRLLGSRTDVADLLGAFDCFVLSSCTEGLAMTLLEAMAAGLPVVATRVGGNAEVVVDGETGLLVPARDTARLFEAMHWMLAHAGAAPTMGARGRERVLSHFSIEAMVAAYQDTYRRALARRGH